LPFEFSEYVTLLNSTARQIVEAKPMPYEIAAMPILDRLNINTEQWRELSTSFSSCFYSVVGSERRLLEYQNKRNLSLVKGRGNALRLLGAA
jgi:hypothetical protein